MRQRRMLGHHHDNNILPLYSNESSTFSTIQKRRKKHWKSNAKKCLLSLGLSGTIMGIIVLGFIVLRTSPKTTSTKARFNDSDLINRIHCDDGSIVFGFMNDDYCDCPDGSDEKTTSACSNVLVQQGIFRCRQNSDIVLFASRVHDGVQDCPDGSDED